MTNNNTAVRGAAQITDAEFLTAFNDASKTNANVLAALNTNWTAVGVKLRSAHLALHTTGTRSAGAKGTYAAHPAKELAYEAKLWKEFGVIQPKKAGYTAMNKAEYTAAKTALVVSTAAAPAPVAEPVEPAVTPALAVAAPVEAAPVAEPVEPTVAPASDVAAPAVVAPVAEPAIAPAPAAFAFRAIIFGNAYEFSGEDRDAAFDGLFRKLRELNFSKIAISDARSNRTIGVNDIVNNGEYKFVKQLTAARAALFMPINTLIVA